MSIKSPLLISDIASNPPSQVLIEPGELMSATSAPVKQERVEAESSTVSLGWLPALTVVGAAGLTLVSIAYAGARAGEGWVQVGFWIGLLVLYVPTAIRLLTSQASRTERFGLIVFLGLALYFVKVMQTPFAFTFPDELAHAFNVDQVLQSNRLFHANPILPVTPLYPGLPAVTAALAAITGLSTFNAGVVVIGVARLVLLLALYLFFEQVSGSQRVGSLASLLYMANANFVFFSSEFAYESLALPLALLSIFAVFRLGQSTDLRSRLGLALVALLGTAAVVMTHHITSYILIACLITIALLYGLISRRTRRGLWIFGLFAVVATIVILYLSSGLTQTYLSFIFQNAYKSVSGFFSGQSGTRSLFESSTGDLAPLSEQAVGIGSILIILIALPYGLRALFAGHRLNPYTLLLALAAIAFFPVLALRLFPGAWETANRSSEFLFLGVSLGVASAIVWFEERSKDSWLVHIALVSAIAVIFSGGLIAGWPPSARLARPYLVDAEGTTIVPQGVTASTWTHDYLGPDNHFAADSTNARLLLAYGQQYPFTGEPHGIRAMFYGRTTDQSVVKILKTSAIRYVLVDRRLISWDALVGVFFDRAPSGAGVGKGYFDWTVYAKFDRVPGVSKILDTGNISIYDVGSMWKASIPGQGLGSKLPGE